MTIIRTYAKLDRKIRYLGKKEKNLKNTIKAYYDEATYHQAVVDDISQKFNLDKRESDGRR